MRLSCLFCTWTVYIFHFSSRIVNGPDGVVWGMFRAVAATASLEQCSSALRRPRRHMLDFGASEKRISNFPLLSLFAVCLSFGPSPSCHHGRTSEAPHSHLLVRLRSAHTRRNQKLTDFSSPSSLPSQGLQCRRPGALPTTYSAAFTQKAFIIPPCVFGLLSSLSPPSLFSSILPPSLHAPLPLFSPEKLFCLIHLH